MAKSNDNDITRGLSGRLGKMISYRRIGNDTEAFRRPGKRKGKATAGQQAHRERFLEASYYAKSTIADPVKKAVYQEKAANRKRAYNLAMADFMKAPIIRSVTTGDYHGQAGDTITIRAIDDFKVTAVKVTITGSNGTVLEEGNAVAQPGGLDWVYTATGNNPQVAGSSVSTTATDLPGNTTSQETILS